MYKLLEKVFELNKYNLFNSVSKNKKSLLKINLKNNSSYFVKTFSKSFGKVGIDKI